MLILVADDSPTIQKVIRIAFSKFSVEIVAAASLGEAVAQFAGRAIDVVVADAALPGTQGPQDFVKITGQAQKPLVLLVGSYENIDENKFTAVGITRFVRKPFESADLVRAVENALGASLVPAAHEPARETLPPVPPLPKDLASKEFVPLKIDLEAIENTGFSIEDSESHGKLNLDADPPTAMHSLPRVADVPNVGPLTDESRKGRPAFEPLPGPPPPPVPRPAAAPNLAGDWQATVKAAVEDYCTKHFATIAREVLTAEIRRLAEERARHLIDQ